jgi:hypothetical protein
MADNQTLETFDVVQWDGLKETALAFFGMPVLDVGERYHFDEAAGTLIEFFHDGSWAVPLGWYLVKDQFGQVSTICEESFNDQYDIIDEYRA